MMGTLSDLVSDLVSMGRLKSKEIIHAFETVDRKEFVRPAHLNAAYFDEPLPINYNQTISQPTTVAIMLEELNARPGQSVLDIGSGSGWTTGLLATIVGPTGSVLGLERVPELALWGQENLAKFNFRHAAIRHAADELGDPSGKYDRILVSAAADTLPKSLLSQLAPDGHLVIPIRDSVYHFHNDPKKGMQSKELFGFRFVPLIYTEADNEGTSS